jgi:DNA-binding MarR family transcriptional regulator
MIGDPFVQLPSRLIDRVMPNVTDTEWRVLCVVARATLGWRNPDGTKKSRDWLTQSQLKRRTGRASAAVSKAIAGLVERGLLRVSSEDGRNLDSREERQRNHGRVFYELSTDVQHDIDRP